MGYLIATSPQTEECDCGFAQGSEPALSPAPVVSTVYSPVSSDAVFCPSYEEFEFEADDYAFRSCCLFDLCALCSISWEVQADVLTPSEDDVVRITKETVKFHDAHKFQDGGIKTTIPRIGLSDQTENIDFVKFLSRPVKIASFTWNESDAVKTSHQFSPWNLYFTDARVKYKLNNFAFISCKLKVKILINASPFYYGAMYCGYQPLPNFSTSTIVADASNRDLIPYSQRPSVWLYPQVNEGAEMELPFFWPYNMLNAQSASEMTNVGQLTFLNYTTLQSANGASGSGVSIVIYAWAEDVDLSGPSVGLATQSLDWEVQSDEYGTGPVSSVASAVASAASWLTDLPVIGPFARATEIGAGAISSIAKIFGFTNVPVIEDTCPYRPEPFPKLASTECGYPVEKLTLDSKNELTISGEAIGLDNTDELCLSYLAGKESFLTQFTWNSSDAVDTLKFTSLVTPNLFDMTSLTQQTAYYLTPMCWLSTLFQEWRGDIIFRFRVVASVFHKGRLRISFDPSGYTSENITTDAASSNVVFTEIVDLSEQTDVEFRVPYQQARAFLFNDSLNIAITGWSTSTTPTWSYDPNKHNGTITVRVQTALTAPVASSSVQVLCFVRAADNIEFANPQAPQQLTTWTVQSDVIGTDTPTFAPERNLVYMGEKVGSLRKLLRRYSMIGMDYIAGNTTNFIAVYQKLYNRIPPMYGYDPTGPAYAYGLIATTTSKNFNYVQNHPLSYVLPAFVAFRGSVNWTFNLDLNFPVRQIRNIRNNNPSNSASGLLTLVANAGTGTTSNHILNTALTCLSGAPGSAMTNQLTNAGLNVACPQYSNAKFMPTSPGNFTLPGNNYGYVNDMQTLEVTLDCVSNSLNGGHLWSYAGIGTDFTMHFFLNVPTYYLYSGAIVPV